MIPCRRDTYSPYTHPFSGETTPNTHLLLSLPVPLYPSSTRLQLPGLYAPSTWLASLQPTGHRAEPLRLCKT